MTRLWIFSDLHQDGADNAWDPCANAPDFDIAIVAGDIHSPLTSAIDWLADRLPGVPTIYVPGNHDFWCDWRQDRFTMADQIDRGRDLAARRGISLLIDDTATIAGIRLLGATLWTDLRLGTSSLLDASHSASRGMNDYHRIRRRRTGKHKYVRPQDTAAAHQTSRAWLDSQLGVPHAGPTVVVTHHAPHPRSLPMSPFDMAHCYASDLSRLILDRQPDLWVHGHVHSRSDFMIGQTRVVCNARGHVEEGSGFDAAFVVSVAHAGGSDAGPRVAPIQTL